jgi:hypothetical protein
MSLEDRNKQVQTLLSRVNSRSIGTQTDPDSPTTPNSFHTALELTPEALDLIPKQAIWQTAVDNENHLNSLVHSFQSFKMTNDIFESWLHQNANDHEQGRLRRPMM